MVSAVSRPIGLMVLNTILAVATMLDPVQVRTQRAGVVIQTFSFRLASMTVPVGTAVTWTNMGSVAYITTSDTRAWDTGTLNPGDDRKTAPVEHQQVHWTEPAVAPSERLVVERVPQPRAPHPATRMVEIVYGLIWAIDAWFMWRPEFLHQYRARRS